MTDPTRLLDDGSPLTRELLAAGTLEEPDAEAMERALAAVAAAGVAAAGVGVALGVARGAAVEGGLGLGLIAKWVGLGAVASAAALGAAHGAGVWPQPAAAVAPTAPTAAPRTVHAPPGAPVGQALPAPPAVAEPSTVAGPALRGAPRAAAEAAPVAAPPASALAAEVAALDRARAAVARGDSAGALGELGRYQERFGQGTLGPEASLLHMEALLAAGRAAEARRVAQQLLAQQPSGPHAARARAVLAGP